MKVNLASDFGYVILVGIASILMLQWMSLKVVMGRKKYDVKYPTMYSDKSPIFNCIQRAHQNTLEGFFVFFILLLLGGLQYPCFNAAAGGTWIISRIMYAWGYYTGEPSGRIPGAALGLFALVAMLGTSTSLGLHLLGIL